MPVLVRINGKPEEPSPINMMPIGNGSFRLYLNGKVRKASGTGVGDRVAAKVRFDAKYRSGPVHPMPAWIRTALGKNPVPRKNWEALIPSPKKEILRYFAALKSPEARNRSLARALHALSGGRRVSWPAHGVAANSVPCAPTWLALCACIICLRCLQLVHAIYDS